MLCTGTTSWMISPSSLIKKTSPTTGVFRNSSNPPRRVVYRNLPQSYLADYLLHKPCEEGYNDAYVLQRSRHFSFLTL
jgi:hypothetical protein